MPSNKQISDLKHKDASGNANGLQDADPESQTVLHRYAGLSSFSASPAVKDDKRFDRKVRSLCLFCKQKIEINLLLAVAALMLSAGFMFAEGTNQNYRFIYDLLDPAAWSFVFLVYGLSKLAQATARIHRVLRYCFGAIGIWVWTFMFLSFSIFDDSPIAPAESLILIFAFAEAWVLLSVVDICGNAKNRRRRLRLQN